MKITKFDRIIIITIVLLIPTGGPILTHFMR